MRRKLIYIFSALCLAGCVANTGLEYDAVSTNNMYHLSRIRKGMNERQVVQIMRQPYDYETYEIGEDAYDVWFYVTQPTVLGQSRMVAQNLTPLSFKNGILVGTGYDYYYFITREDAKQRAAAMPPPARQPNVPIRDPSQKAPAAEPQPQPTPAPEEDIPPQSSKQPEPENKDLEESLQKANETHDQTPEDLQAVPKPTAPILSSLESPLAAKNLSKVKKGMSQEEVQNILGDPEEDQTFQLGDDVYDVWFYKTGGHRVPLTFKNTVLVGMTTEYYNEIREAAEHDQINGYDKKGEEMQGEESDQNFNYW